MQNTMGIGAGGAYQKVHGGQMLNLCLTAI